MSDIFISYAREDLHSARWLAEAFARQEWSIFWDRTIPTGKTWREVIGAALADARCVVVLWSNASIESTWVQEEADDGRLRGILVPALVEDVQPAIGFRSFQAADLIGWNGDPEHQGFRQLADAVSALLDEPAPSEAEAKADQEQVAPEDTGRMAEEETRREAEIPQLDRTEPATKRKTEESKKPQVEREETRRAVEAAPLKLLPKISSGPAKWSALAVVVLLLVGGIWLLLWERGPAVGPSQYYELKFNI